MQVAIVPFENVKAHSIHQGIFNVFDTFETSKCLLDCADWKQRQNAFNAAARTAQEKKHKRNLQRQWLESSNEQRKRPNSSPAPMRSQRACFTFAEISGSAENGCEGCSFLSLLVKGTSEACNEKCHEDLMFAWDRYSYVLEIFDQAADRYLSFQLFTLEGSGLTIVGMPSSRPLSGDTSLAASLDRAQEWIRTCEVTHNTCRSGRDTPLPRRVLDLTPIQKGLRDGIRLKETLKGELGTYACLSHCWGKALILARTTSQCIESFLHFIPWDLLPKNFQDSIIIARYLGLQYLWIDSLCIMQDSKDEWEEESGKMADIYSNGFLVIAAVASADSRGGCFSVSTPDKCLRIRRPNEPDLLIGSRICDGAGRLHDKAEIVRQRPLFTRAWVYQERMLSRRILYCNRAELAFECGWQGLCECGNSKITPHILQGQIAGSLLPKKVYSAIHAQPSNLVSLNNRWQDTVADYSKLQLTYPGDKLPALSGCSKEVERMTGDKYLAGLWQRTLGANLLWFVGERNRSSRPLEYRAPSWSWASVDAPDGIRFMFPPNTGESPWYSFEKKVGAVECVPAGKDTTGAVKSGFIVLKTSMRPVHLRYVCQHCRHNMPTNGRFYEIETVERLSGSLKPKNPCAFSQQGIGLSATNFLQFYSDLPNFANDNDLEFSGPIVTGPFKHTCQLAPVYLLHITENQSRAGVYNYYLVLKRLKLKVDHYERIGLVVIGHKSLEQNGAQSEVVWPQDLTSSKSVILV